MRRDSFYLGIGSPYAEGGDSRELRGAATDDVEPLQPHVEGVLAVPAARVPAMLAALDEVHRWMRRGLVRDAGGRGDVVDALTAALAEAGEPVSVRDLARTLSIRRPTAERALEALADRLLVDRVLTPGDPAFLYRGPATSPTGWHVSRQDEAVTLMGPIITFGLGKALEATQAVELLYRDLPALRGALAETTVPA